jgi:GntR family transcriptional regulator, carbon starvation induced regulator
MATPDHGRYVESAYEQIRNQILRLEYPPGMPLRLNVLSGLHGGSMTPIREALRRLEAERLVEVIPNKGARVSDISTQDLEDAYSTRIVIEVAALRRAADAMRAEDLDHVKKRESKMNSLLASDSIERGLEAHQQFHFALYELSESEWLMSMIRVLWSHTERYRRIATQRRSVGDIAQEHRKIVDALERHDTDAACDALTQHLKETAAATLEMYRELEDAKKPQDIHRENH